MGLSDFINQLSSPGKATPVKNYKQTRDQILAMAIIPNANFPYDWNASFTYPTGYKKIGASVAATSDLITGKTILNVIRSLTLQSKAWFYPEGTMKGSKAMATPTKEQEAYGIQTVANDTGQLTELAELKIKGMHLDQAFWNTLRVNGTGYTVILFLDNRAIWIRPENVPSFHDIGTMIGGDANNSITGGSVQLSYQSDGDIIWVAGPLSNEMLMSNWQFTFADPTPTTLTIVSCASGRAKLTGTASGGGSFTRPVLEAAYAACVTYTGEILSGPAETGITVNPDTGVVTVGTGGVAGTYVYRVIAQNNTSFYATYDVVIVLT